jgi:hypothetical protein
MTTRHLKTGKKWVMGKNGKKLRYLFDKKNKTIVLKAPINWTENAHNDLVYKYEDFTVKKDVVKKRGRPKKVKRNEENKTKFKSAATEDTSEDNDFNVGDRVKSDNSLGVGTIIEITNRKKAKIKFSDNYTEIIHFRYIKKARGRKAKQKLFVNKEADKEADLLEILKHHGKMYLINNINEVMTMSGDYVGIYEDGEITE